MITWPELALDDPRVVRTLRRWGHPYGWAKGSPATADDPGSDRDDSDCSGEAQETLVEAGELDAAEPDRSSHELAMICDPVKEGDERPYDLAFYGEDGRITHVMVVVGTPGRAGRLGRAVDHARGRPPGLRPAPPPPLPPGPGVPRAHQGGAPATEHLVNFADATEIAWIQRGPASW